MGDDFVSRNGRERRGARDGNDRVARIARWLNQPVKSPSVTELVLDLEDGEVLGRWPRDDVSTLLAPDIDAILLDAANDAATTIGARLAWVTADGTRWASKGFRARCADGEQEHIRPLDGSLASQLQQNQRHTEALAGQLAQMTARSDERFEKQMGIFVTLNGVLLKQLELSEKRREAAEEREQQTLDLAEAAAEQAEAAAQDAAAAQAQKDDPMGKVIEIATKQLLSGGGA